MVAAGSLRPTTAQLSCRPTQPVRIASGPIVSVKGAERLNVGIYPLVQTPSLYIHRKSRSSIRNGPLCFLRTPRIDNRVAAAKLVGLVTQSTPSEPYLLAIERAVVLLGMRPATTGLPEVNHLEGILATNLAVSCRRCLTNDMDELTPSLIRALAAEILGTVHHFKWTSGATGQWSVAEIEQTTGSNIKTKTTGD